MMLVKFGNLPLSGGFNEQEPRFIDFCFIAMSCESEANKKSLKRMKLKK